MILFQFKENAPSSINHYYEVVHISTKKERVHGKIRSLFIFPFKTLAEEADAFAHENNLLNEVFIEPLIYLYVRGRLA